MLRITDHLRLSRRVAAYTLLVGLFAIALLALGCLVAVRSFLIAQATDTALSRVARMAAAIELDHVRTNGRRLQLILEQTRSETRFVYAAVVGSDGRFRAHTEVRRVGESAVEPIGKPLHWGEIQGIRFSTPNGSPVSEYVRRLDAGDEPIGTLRVAIAEPTLAGVLVQFGPYVAWTLIAPLVVIGLGYFLLFRLLRPIDEIDSQLARLATANGYPSDALSSVTPRGLPAVGWNRLMTHLDELRAADSAIDPELKLAARSGHDDGPTRDALESLAEGIAVTDAEGRVDFANCAVEALLGLDNQIEGDSFLRTLESVSPPGAQPFYDVGRATLTVAEAPIEGDRTLRVERAPLRSCDSSAAGHVWSVRDVTQQKLVEASRDQFIDTATHELRTPLSNIKAYAETLASGDFKDIEQQKEFCNTINTEATRLGRFVDDLLSISSLETGSLSVARLPVKVLRLAEEAAEKVRPLMQSRSLKFETKLSEKLGEASLDKDKISGLLVNLLGNAAKYSPEGSSVTFTAVRKDDELLFEVRDTGYGIAEEEQHRVFDKFFRSDNPEVRDNVGTGLGLSLAREIARLHRGDITLHSKLGEGSTFAVTLPVS